MDAQDTRTAQERIDQAEGRLAALQEQGIDTAGLNSQLAFARSALAHGQTLDVMAMCEEVLIAAKRLVAQPPVAANRLVKTDRLMKTVERVSSGLYPSIGGQDDARDRQRLTEEIRQAVHSDLMPKALSASQLNERIRTTVERTLDERLKALQDNLSSRLDERFQRLAAEPGTSEFSNPPSVEDITARIEAQVTAELDQRMESRASALSQQLTNEVGLKVDHAVAQLHGTMTSLDATLPATVANLVNATLPDAVQAAVQAAMQVAMATVTEAVTAPVRELVAEALSQSKSAPPDLDALATRLGNDLRSDLDWQVERLAAEKGWVTLADVHAELRTNGNLKPGADSNHAPGFARLEAALVEFVRQTQSQQQQFLNVLQERVEQGTAVVAQSFAKAIAADKHRSSTVFRQPPKPNDGDTATINRATDARVSDDQSALESHTSSAHERELDSLSMTAQYRAIDTLGDPQRQTPILSMLPGTQVTARTAAGMPSLTSKFSPADDHSSATRPSTMVVSNRAALDPSRQEDTPEVDASALTRESSEITADLGTEAIEMAPLHDSVGESSGLVARTDERQQVLENSSAKMVAAAVRQNSEISSTAAITRILTHTISSPSAAVPGQPATAGSSQLPPPTGKTVNPTSRVTAFETGLRNLVKGEVERQLGTGSIAKVPATSALNRETATPDLDQRIRVAIQKALAERPAAPTGSEVRLTVPCDTDLRAAITRSMPDMLQDPAIRQQILGLVAVEAVANPGALGELTGIRAFIRAEVRHAHGEAMPQVQRNDTTTAVPPSALETPSVLIS